MKTGKALKLPKKLPKKTKKDVVHHGRSRKIYLEMYLLLMLSLLLTVMMFLSEMSKSHPQITKTLVQGADSPSVANQTSPLPHDMPSVSTLRSKPRKVFAHYFPPYTLSLHNEATADSDYYATNFMQINGVGGKYAAGGGLLRDRPLTPNRTIAGGTTSTCPHPYPNTNATWRIDNMKKEVNWAINGGIDGFTLDILVRPPHTDYKVCQNPYLMMQAAKEVDPNFKLIIRPSMRSLYKPETGGITPSELANFMVDFANHPSAFRLADGRVVIHPFMTELYGGPTVQESANYWKEFLQIMKDQKGIRVAFIASPLNYTSSFGNIYNATISSEFLYGFSEWGTRSPGSNPASSLVSLGNDANDAHAKGKIWVQPVSPQDYRARDVPASAGDYFEAQNSGNLRQTWEAAIKYNAEWVDLVTWNDYSEHSHIAPSQKNGFNLLDLNSQYVVKFKNGGATPAVARDSLYLTHRVHKHSVPPPSPQIAAKVRTSGSSAPRDIVEVMSFLKSPAKVSVTIGPNTTVFDAPAGQFIKDFPLEAGVVSASIVYPSGARRNVTSPHTVLATVPRQDFMYYTVSSGRQGTDTAAPAPTPAPVPPPPAPVTNPTPAAPAAEPKPSSPTGQTSGPTNSAPSSDLSTAHTTPITSPTLSIENATNTPIKVAGTITIAEPNGAGTVAVAVDGKPTDDKTIDTAELTNGNHTITITDTKSGKTANQEIIVNNPVQIALANHVKKNAIIYSSSILVAVVVIVMFIHMQIHYALATKLSSWLHHRFAT